MVACVCVHSPTRSRKWKVIRHTSPIALIWCLLIFRMIGISTLGLPLVRLTVVVLVDLIFRMLSAVDWFWCGLRLTLLGMGGQSIQWSCWWQKLCLNQTPLGCEVLGRICLAYPMRWKFGVQSSVLLGWVLGGMFQNLANREFVQCYQ